MELTEELQLAARRLHRQTAARAEAATQPIDYNSMEKTLNKAKFMQPPDAATTKSTIYYMRKKFQR